jgi:hypothetical protein
MKIFQLIDLIIRLFRLNNKSKVVLLFLIPTFLIGQNNAAFWLGKRATGAAPTNLLLDDYPGAAAAYSVRKLDKDYTGFAMEIRRASDNATQNIGFTGNDLNTVAINSFCSGTTCTVRTWYDQSGNGRDILQSTPSVQPSIYSGGAVITDNGKPTISFDNIDDFLQYNLAGANNSHFFFVHKFRSQPDTDEYLLDTDTRVSIFPWTGGKYGVYGGISVLTNINVTFNLVALNFEYAGSSSVLTVNTTRQTINPGTLSFNTVRHARNYGSATNYAPLNLTEFIYYPTRKTNTERNAIENNINSYFSIY